MASLGMVLEQYPNEVIVYVTDPRTGVQRNCKWPPTIAEIVAACDAHQHHLMTMRRFENWGNRNETALLEAPRETRPTYAELKEKYGENFGLAAEKPKPPPKAAPDWQQITTFYERNPDRAKALVKALDRQGIEDTDA